MAPLNVQIKHAGKKYDVVLDPDLPPLAFKESIYQSTGIPVDRMKVMVKGGVLKDDADWKKIGPKEGQTFMVIGAAGELPKPPTEPTKFLEDMDEAELADVLQLPVGLVNLGNTCYMSATVQAMRAIPELQVSLSKAREMTPLMRSVRDLYKLMASSTGGVLPLKFLEALREAVPQFAERTPRGYSQQDAEECWTQMTNRLKDLPGYSAPQGSSAPPHKLFVDQFMAGTIVREMKSIEASDEPPSISSESVLKIECNIGQSTNFMLAGIMDALNTTVIKQSPSLGREATYDVRARLSRLPTYLTVHMVRFTWRRDIGKKAKIMRKVKFPTEFDALDITTDDLRGKLQPVSRRLAQIEGERAERRKVRKRTRVPAASASTSATVDGDVQMADAEPTPVGEDAPAASAPSADDSTLKPEKWYREQERTELRALVDSGIKEDIGASQTGLYDLVAIITHKGAAADSGHYIAFVKKSALSKRKSASTSAVASTQAARAEQYAMNAFMDTVMGGMTRGMTNALSGRGSTTTEITVGDVQNMLRAGRAQAQSESSISDENAPLETTADDTIDDEDDDWFKFDDEKVSVFPKDKLATLDGGGEDSSAYVLIYKSKSV
ncbi:cysteine proteinase [Artomyces pyxidatus]|uniref:Cysteine proteinase n=1 Tax=Artomyces pyxidatus TaxID=48021 RepID=A0ACB8T3J6_9AGAM|nr:cysteine proteinase [Artomyces pyxidatus]